MKKISLLIIAFMLIGTYFANSQTFNKGTTTGNICIGIGTPYDGGGLPFSASFEIGVADHIIDKGSIGIGGTIGYSSASYRSYTYTNFLIGPRGAFHYAFVDKLDTYAGITIAYHTESTNIDIPYYSYNNGITSYLFAGARYYFSEKFAVVGELGSSFAYLNIGILYKFK